jgi:hypothetical protein
LRENDKDLKIFEPLRDHIGADNKVAAAELHAAHATGARPIARMSDSLKRID